MRGAFAKLTQHLNRKATSAKKSARPASTASPATSTHPQLTLFPHSFILLHRLVLSSSTRTAASSQWPSKSDFARINIKILKILRTPGNKPTRPPSVPGLPALRRRMSLSSAHLHRSSMLLQVSQPFSLVDTAINSTCLQALLFRRVAMRPVSLLRWPVQQRRQAWSHAPRPRSPPRPLRRRNRRAPRSGA